MLIMKCAISKYVLEFAQFLEHEKHMVGIPKICPILEPCGFHQYLISEEIVYTTTHFSFNLVVMR